MDKQYIEKFVKWVNQSGGEILPVTNQFEAIRFKGKSVGVIYKSGKFSSPYAYKTIKEFESNKKWSGSPISTGRFNSYKKQKPKLIERDGTKCFLCGEELHDDITVEHLISLSSGGKNNLSNMVLTHSDCNEKLGTKPINEKVQMAINNRLKLK